MEEPGFEAILADLSGPPEPSEPPAPSGDWLLDGFSRRAWQAGQLRQHLIRLQTARRQLPNGRLAFTVDCLELWGDQYFASPSAMKEAKSRLDAAIESTAPNSDARRSTALPQLEEYMRLADDVSLRTVLYRPIRRARQQWMAVRIGVPLLIAVLAIILEMGTQLSAAAAIVFALILHAVVDIGFVDRWLEPRLARAEEEALDRAIADVIPMAERLSDGFQRVAATLRDREGGAGLDGAAG